MTQIDEPNLDEQIRSALRIAKHIAETGGDGLEERQVDEIKALISDQVAKARTTLLQDLNDCGEIHHSVYDYRIEELEQNK